MVSAGNIQYDLGLGDVTGVSDAAIPDVPGYATIAVEVAASAIAWPHPPGCPSAEMHVEWITITDPALVTGSTGAGMAIRSEVEPFLFTTTSTILPGCHFVGSWQELKRLYEQAIIQAIAAEDLVTAISALNGWKDVRCVPGIDDGNANCQAWTAQLSIVNQRLPGRGQGITLLDRDRHADHRRLCFQGGARLVVVCSRPSAAAT